MADVGASKIQVSTVKCYNRQGLSVASLLSWQRDRETDLLRLNLPCRSKPADMLKGSGVTTHFIHEQVTGTAATH